jgi:aspartate aminotransferase-like enzyme
MRTTEDKIKTLEDIAVRIGTLGYIEKSKDAELVAALQAIVRKAGK